MKYERFEELTVWQLSASLAADMFRWTANTEFRGKGDLANQLQRAALSISNNIAEGFERGTTNELITFLYYSRGSAGEVRSMLAVMNRMPEFASFQTEIGKFRSTCEGISRQLRGWLNSLQNSDIAGQRHLNDKTRTQYQQIQRRRDFEQELSANMQEIAKKIQNQAEEVDREE